MAGPSSWRCDGCGTAVAADGGVLAFRTQDQLPYAVGGFQILHGTCLPPTGSEVDTVGLAACLDRDGLSLLLAFLSAGPGRSDEPGPAVQDLDEFVDLIRRLHVPSYETARPRFGEPLVRAALRQADRVGPYQSTDLHRLARGRPGSAARA